MSETPRHIPQEELTIYQANGNDSMLGSLIADRPESEAAYNLAVRNADMLDMAERGRREQEKLASVDAVTGLNNRRAWNERAYEVAAEVERTDEGVVLVWMFDIKKFKDFNEDLGDPVGDQALRVVADALRAVTRPYDDIFRYGGDEFALLQRDTQRSRRVERHRELLKQAATISEVEFEESKREIYDEDVTMLIPEVRKRIVKYLEEHPIVAVNVNTGEEERRVLELHSGSVMHFSGRIQGVERTEEDDIREVIEESRLQAALIMKRQKEVAEAQPTIP